MSKVRTIEQSHEHQDKETEFKDKLETGVKAGRVHAAEVRREADEAQRPGVDGAMAADADSDASVRQSEGREFGNEQPALQNEEAAENKGLADDER